MSSKTQADAIPTVSGITTTSHSESGRYRRRYTNLFIDLRIIDTIDAVLDFDHHFI